MHPTVRTDAPMKASKIGVAKVRDKPRLETKSLRSGLGTVLCERRFPKKSFVGMHPTVRTDAPTKASKIGVARVRIKLRLETQSHRSRLNAVPCGSRFLNIF